MRNPYLSIDAGSAITGFCTSEQMLSIPLQYHQLMIEKTELGARILAVKTLAMSELSSLIETELALGFTFLQTAMLSRDAGHFDHEKQALNNARQAYEVAADFLAHLPDMEAAKLQPRLDALRAALQPLDPRMFKLDAHG